MTCQKKVGGWEGVREVREALTLWERGENTRDTSRSTEITAGCHVT